MLRRCEREKIRDIEGRGKRRITTDLGHAARRANMHGIGFVFPRSDRDGLRGVTVFELANFVLDESAYEVTVPSEAKTPD